MLEEKRERRDLITICKLINYLEVDNEDLLMTTERKTREMRTNKNLRGKISKQYKKKFSLGGGIHGMDCKRV